MRLVGRIYKVGMEKDGCHAKRSDIEKQRNWKNSRCKNEIPKSLTNVVYQTPQPNACKVEEIMSNPDMSTWNQSEGSYMGITPGNANGRKTECIEYLTVK